MSENVENKVIIVTGGSSGIGKATAELFARQGARVVVANRNAEKGHAVVDSITQDGGTAIFVQTDVSRAPQVENMVIKTIDTFGRLDYAFNNGGSGGGGGLITEMTESSWDATMNGYLKSTWLCMKYQIPEMLKSGGGAIVNCSSVDGLRGFPAFPAYSAAKHGVIGLTKSTAMQYAKQGIRVNAICPGWIRTPPIQSYLDARPEGLEKMLQHQPIGRVGEPSEIAETVLFLCSSKASLITGTALPVDGGYTCV